MTMDVEKSWAPNPDITPEELEEMRKVVVDNIITARVKLLLRYPWFGNMATRLKIKAADEWCPTAATDGRHLYYNTQFFFKMDIDETIFVIAHEILHCVFDHMERRDDRDPYIYNISADYKVNNTLVRERTGKMPHFVNAFQDFKYENWTSEEIYDELYQKAKENGRELLEQLGELLDEHIDWEDDGAGSAGDGKGGKDKKSGPPKYSKEELQKIKDEIKESMIQAAQTSGAGNVPGEINRMIKELTEPKMNWRELLQQQIQSTIRDDYTFARPSRKGWHTGAILPGMNFMETIDLCIAIDMSGSIGDDQGRDFLSEVKGIMDQYKDYNIKIWCFDTKVYNEQDYAADSGESISEYQLRGGGGTDFMCNWTYMKEEGIEPKKFIMFTDGYAWDSWGDPDYCDTIFIIHNNHDKNLQGPFGTTAHYAEAA